MQHRERFPIQKVSSRAEIDIRQLKRFGCIHNDRLFE